MLTSEEIIRLIFSLLGGGLVVGILNLWNLNKQERKRRRIDFLRAQLQELYGPLQFFTSCNAELYKLTDKLNSAYKDEYVNRQWSQEYNTQENVRNNASKTIDLSNQYIRQVTENGEKIINILTSKYSLIDPSDIEVSMQFIVDYTRNKTEFGETGLRTPFEIYQHLGPISFMRPEFISAIDKSFHKKKLEIEKLIK